MIDTLCAVLDCSVSDVMAFRRETQPELKEVSMYFWELTVSEKSWRSLASISSC